MAHFTLGFGPDPIQTSRIIARADACLQSVLHVAPRISELCGVSVSLASENGFAPIVVERQHAFLIVKGTLIDMATEFGDACLQDVLDEFVSTGTIDFQHLQGAFAAVIWDAQRQRGIAFNDQTSQLNLYYVADPRGVFFTTTPVALAKAMSVGLSAEGICEFLARGCVCAPTTMFRGFKKLDLGEHVEFDHRSLQVATHWIPFAEPRAGESFQDATTHLADTVTNVVARHDHVAQGGTVLDLTGGYDSRTVVAAFSSSGKEPLVTVNGTAENVDVRIAKMIASELGWKLIHFDHRAVWNTDMSFQMRRECTFRGNGELEITRLYNGLLNTCPTLRQSCELVASGGGGEFLRYFPWGQEFFGIGRRRPANIDRIVRYRFLPSGIDPTWFTVDWRSGYLLRLHDHLRRFISTIPGSLTTQQLDAAHIWKMTSHFSMWVTAQNSLLPHTCPLMTSAVVDAAIATPWKHRLTSHFQRAIINTLDSKLASFPTAYGGAGAPPSLATLHLEARQIARRAHHLFDKVWKVAAPKSFRLSSTANPYDKVHVPFVHDELRQFLHPDSLYCKGLYDQAKLTQMVDAMPDDLMYGPLVRLATLEHLCRELGEHPDEQLFQQYTRDTG